MLMPFFMPVSVGPAAISFRTSVVDTTNGSSFTFSSVDIGTASNDRKVVVGISATGGSSSATVSSVTVAGDAMTAIGQITDTNGMVTALFQRNNVSSGTTADIVVTFNESESACGIGVWAVTAASSAAHDTLTNADEPSTGTIDCPANGAIIAVGSTLSSVASVRTTTWTGVDENYDETVEATQHAHSAGSKTFTTTQTGLTITATASGATDDEGLACGSWGPG